ncbi:MAG: aspartate kinase [Clostridia bacterium]|jgi:aspartate kinase
MRIVYKYGGSSVATLEKINAIAQRLKFLHDKGYELVVVVSAMGKTTNELITTAQQLSSKPNKRELDALMCTGEIKSITLLAIALNELGVPAVSFNAYQAGIYTNNNYTRAFIDHIDTTKLEKVLAENAIAIVAGFQGVTESGDLATLGRGGSDTTAVALAAALKCDCNIYTDVSGIYSIDPRIYASAKKLDTIPYSDMMELAVNGANVLEPRSVELAAKFGVKLYVGQSLESEQKGTIVMNGKDYFERIIISGIAVKEHISLVSLKLNNVDKRLLYKVFGIIAKSSINLNMVSCQNFLDNTILSFSCSLTQAEEFIDSFKTDADLNEIEINIQKDLTQISVTGTGMSTHTTFIANILKTLTENYIEFSNITNSEISFSFLVMPKYKESAIKVLAERFEI